MAALRIPSHMENLPIMCKICNESFTLGEYAAHQPGCVQETETFVDSFNGSSKIRVHVEDSKKCCMLACKFCNKPINQSELKQHITEDCDQVPCPYESETLKQSIQHGIEKLLPPNSFVNLGEIPNEQPCNCRRDKFQIVKQNSKQCRARAPSNTFINRAKRIIRKHPYFKLYGGRKTQVILCSKHTK